MRKYTALILCALLMLSGCKANVRQDKAEITPYSQVRDISYTKQTFEILGIQLSSPQQIAAFEDNLFICDAGNSRIIKCDLQGNLNDELTVNSLVEPICVDVSSSRICVYDRGSGKILALNWEGELLWEYDFQSKFNFLSEIVDIEICGDETVYFSLLVHKKNIEESGLYMLKSGNITKISDYTVGCLTSAENNVYFMSKYELLDDDSWMSGYAEMLKISGENCERVSAFSDSFSASGIDIFDENIYTFDFCSQSVEMFSVDGKYIKTMFADPVVNDFVYKGFCADKNGNLYLSDSAGNTIYKLVKK